VDGGVNLNSIGSRRGEAVKGRECVVGKRKRNVLTNLSPRLELADCREGRSRLTEKRGQKQRSHGGKRGTPVSLDLLPKKDCALKRD